MHIRKTLLCSTLISFISCLGCDVATGYLACTGGDNCIVQTPECCLMDDVECSEEEESLCQEHTEAPIDTCKPERNQKCDGCANGSTCINDQNGLGIMLVCNMDNYSEAQCNNTSCNRNFTGCGKCLNGNHCIDDPDTQEGKSIDCDNGQIKKEEFCKNKETHTSCLKKEDSCGVCLNDTYKCENEGSVGYIKTCVDGAYKSDECKFKNSCKNDKECGTCQNGSTCKVSSKQYKKCRSGKWENCASNENCNSSRSCT